MAQVLAPDLLARHAVPTEDFIAAMRANVTPVNLVTTDGPAGRSIHSLER